MAKASIKIVDKTIKEPKIVGDVVELVFKIEMNKSLPKGLECLGSSMYKVLVAKKQWNKLVRNNVVTSDSEFIVEGQPKALVSKKGTPFTFINCTNIQIKPTKEKEVKNEKKLEPIADNNQKKRIIPWFNMVKKDDFIDIDISSVDIDLEEHKFGYLPIGDNVSKQKIAVIKKEDGRYTLLAGFKQFANAKIFGKTSTLSAYVFEGTREEFNKKFNIIIK